MAILASYSFLGVKFVIAGHRCRLTSLLLTSNSSELVAVVVSQVPPLDVKCFIIIHIIEELLIILSIQVLTFSILINE